MTCTCTLHLRRLRLHGLIPARVHPTANKPTAIAHAKRRDKDLANDRWDHVGALARAVVRQTILNPARLDCVHANDVCIQCHSLPGGTPRSGISVEGRELYAPAQSRGAQSHAFSPLNEHPNLVIQHSTDFDLLPSLVRPSM